MKIGRYIRTISAVIGVVLLLGAVGTSDYHTIGLGQREPSSVWVLMAVGAALMLPLIIGSEEN